MFNTVQRGVWRCSGGRGGAQTDDDDGCTSQQSEQGEEHHLVAVDEAVQGMFTIQANNWSSSC